MIQIETLAFIVLSFLLSVYAVLDGFDLGIGIIQRFFSSDKDRLALQQTIGPIWNGNEVWLITTGGALFAAFPPVYATFCSAFYFPVMLLLVSFILRAISIEVRDALAISWWRKTCDTIFCGASASIVIIFGIALGNLIQGISLDKSGDYIGTFFDLFHPYCLLISLFLISLFSLHGALFSLLKTGKELHDKVRAHIFSLFYFFITVYIITFISTWLFQPHLIKAATAHFSFFGLVIINALAIARTFFALKYGYEKLAFFSFCASICSLIALYALGSFPILIRSLISPETNSLSIYSSAASPTALSIFLIYVAIGIPLVLAYSFFVYRIFSKRSSSSEETY